MSQSSGMDESHLRAFQAYVGPPDPEYLRAEAWLAAWLGVELEPGEHFGEKGVLDPDVDMIARCHAIVDAAPSPAVLDVLVEALQGSYHLVKVHALLTRIGRLTVERWVAGDRGMDQREVLRGVSQAYRWGVKAGDLDMLLEFCNELSLVDNWDGGENFLSYWFDSLAKIKDPRVASFCREIIANDLERWADSRLYDAVPVIGKRWEPADRSLLEAVAKEHPDSLLRRVARRIIEKHS